MGLNHQPRKSLHGAKPGRSGLAAERRELGHRSRTDRIGGADFLACPRQMERPLAPRGLAEVALLHLPCPGRELRRIERARPGAEPAADALVGIDDDDSVVGPLRDRGDRARGPARRVTAVHARHRHVHRLDVGKRPALDLHHLAPSRPDVDNSAICFLT